MRHTENRQSEKALIALLFLLGFFAVGVTSVFTSTAANTLFLTNFDVSSLAYSYLGFAVVAPLIGTCYLRLQAKWPLRSLIVAALAVDVVVLLCFRAALFFGADRVWLFGLKVWYDAELVLTSIVFWGLANQLLTLRQGKRLFGIVGAGDPLAVVIGGLATPLLLRYLSPADLLMLSAFGSTTAIAVVLVILSRFSPLENQTREDGEDAPIEQQDLRSLFRDGYVRLIFAGACLSLFAYFLVDNAFYAGTKDWFPEQGDLARFLGLYMAVAGAVSLLSALGIAGPLISRFGVWIGLMALPSLLLFFSVIATGTVGLHQGVVILFGCIMANRVLDFALRGTVDKSSMLALYQPFSAARRLRVQTAVESMVEPFAAAISGLCLLFVMKVLGWRARELTILVMAVALAWIGTLVFVRRQYIAELARALATRRLGRLTLEIGENAALLERGLKSSHAGEVLYCLHLLTSSGRPVMPGRLLELIDHPLADVRLAVAQAMEQRADPAFADPLRRRMRTDEDPRVSTALLSACLACSPEAVDEIIPFLDKDSSVRNGAIIALLRHGGMDGILVAGERLMAAIRSDLPCERKQAAAVLAAVASPLFHRLLIRLLDDPQIPVRRAALLAAIHLDAPSLWPMVIAQIEVAGLERAAQAVLIAAGERCFPVIDAALTRPELPVHVRLRLIEVLGRIGGVGALSRLLAPIGTVDWQVRLALFRALQSCNYGCPPNAEKLLWEQINELAGIAAWALSAAKDLPAEPCHFDALRRSLIHEVDKSITGIFHLLGSLFPGRTIEDARESFLHGPIAKRAYALESIEQMLPVMTRGRIMALLEPDSVEERQKQLNCHFPHQPLAIETRLIDILSSSHRITPWTAAVTLFAITKSKITLRFDSATVARRFDDEIVHETLAWMESQSIANTFAAAEMEKTAGDRVG
jgi:ATP:ADP antiporter, AAA family